MEITYNNIEQNGIRQTVNLSSVDETASRSSVDQLMASKNVSTKRSKVPCGVCQAPVIDGKDEALLCEGECGLWLHRGCASVPPCHYKTLSTSDEPFICLCCSNYQLRKELAQVKMELSGATALADAVEIAEAGGEAAKGGPCRSDLGNLRRSDRRIPTLRRQPLAGQPNKLAIAHWRRTKEVRIEAATKLPLAQTHSSSPHGLHQLPSELWCLE